MEKFGRWLITSRGRIIALGIITAPYIVGGIYHTYINIFDHKHCLTSLYELKDKDGNPVRLVKPVRRLIKQELLTYEEKFITKEDHMTRLSSKAKEYAFYTSNDLEFHFFGRAPHFAGCSIAFPYYLCFSRPEDIKDEFLFARTTKNYSLWHLFQDPIPLKVDWSSKLGAEFRDSLLLSVDAKKYAVRRALHEANSSLGVLRPGAYFLPACILAIGFQVMDNGIRVFQLFKPSVQVPVFFLLLCIGPMMVKIMKDYCDITVAREIDREILYGEDWVQYKKGAIEFFEKNIQRNQSLREILKENGAEKLYSVDGNILTSQLKLTDRLKVIKKFVNTKFPEKKDHQESQNQTIVVPVTGELNKI